MRRAVGPPGEATRMKRLNCRHLLQFWPVAREGGVAMAAATLHLAQSTVSGQVHALEDTLGEGLFEREGRRQYRVEVVGRPPEVSETYYAISTIDFTGRLMRPSSGLLLRERRRACCGLPRR